MIDPINKLCKWRMVLAGWHNGTQSIGAPGARAMRDLMDKWLLARIEGNALGRLCIDKGLFTAAEYTAQLHEEARVLDEALEEQFPGFRTGENGVVIYDQRLANETMTRLGFPP